MLIPNKNRINETLKNPENLEKRLFYYVFLLFLSFFNYFLCLFRFLVVILQ